MSSNWTQELANWLNFIEEPIVSYRHVIVVKSKNLYIFFAENSIPKEFYSSNQKKIIVWKDWWYSKKELIQSRILYRLGKSKRIHGRKTEVVRINKQLAESFFEENHLQGYTQAHYKIGLKYKENIVAAALFSKGRNFIKNGKTYKSFEWIRYAGLKNHHVTGGVDKLLVFFEGLSFADHIMTYVDKEWGDGSVYTKLGFIKDGESEKYIYWLDSKNQTRYFPSRYLKQHPEINTPDEAGLIAIEHPGNIKMIKWVADEK